MSNEARNAALEDAQNLAAFFGEAVADTFASGSEPSIGIRMGLALTFSLLQDKLMIARDELALPLSTLFPDEADGVLWKPESKESADAE